MGIRESIGTEKEEGLRGPLSTATIQLPNPFFFCMFNAQSYLHEIFGTQIKRREAEPRHW